MHFSKVRLSPLETKWSLFYLEDLSSARRGEKLRCSGLVPRPFGLNTKSSGESFAFRLRKRGAPPSLRPPRRAKAPPTEFFPNLPSRQTHRDTGLVPGSGMTRCLGTRRIWSPPGIMTATRRAEGRVHIIRQEYKRVYEPHPPHLQVQGLAPLRSIAIDPV